MIRSRLVAAAVISGTIVLGVPTGAFGADAGDLDPSFSGDGQLTTAFGTTPFHAADTGSGAVRLATGQVYVAGWTSGETDSDFALVKFDASGVLDSSFGGGDGIVITDLSSGSEDQASAVSVNASTGNIVVAGTTTAQGSDDDDFAVVRYTSTGTLDPGFGGDGIVTTDIAGADTDSATAVAHIDPSSATSNIIVAGTTKDANSGAGDFALVAYTSAGALDTSFDGNGGSGNGKVITDFGSDDDFAMAIRITAGPKILVAGGTDPLGTDVGDFALARYSASTGVLDTTFGPGTDGKQTVSFSSNPSGGNGDYATALTTDGTGRIVVAGFAGPGNGDFGVARLDATTGALDNTLDTDGKQTVTTPGSGNTINSQDQCNAVTVQADGKILLAGQEFTSPHWMLARMSDTGVPDAGFGASGIVLTEFGTTPSSTTAATAVIVDASTIVAAGTADDNFAAVRYLIGNGAPDLTYDSDGTAEADVPHAVPSSETAKGVVVQPDGKVIAVGPTNVDAITQFGGDMQFGLARYNTDGTLDAGFGAGGVDGDGRVSTNFDTLPNGVGTDDTAAAVALQSDGKIVVAGTTGDGSDPGTNDFAVARYNANGTLDTTFAPLSPLGPGKLAIDFGGPNGDSGSAVAIEGTPGSPGFRIVVAGTESLVSQGKAFAVAAISDDGALDGTFDSDGKQTTNLNGVYPASGLALQPDGKVLVAGTAGDFFPPGPTDFAIVRYDVTGTPDGTFGGGDGIVTTDFAFGYDEGDAVAVEDLGASQVRIVVTGRAAPDASTTADAGVAAYTTDGTLDPAFAPGGTDGDGKLTFDLASDFDALRDVAFQPDGKIIGSGTVGSPDFGLARLTSSGALDSSFGGDGLVSTSFGAPGQNMAAGVALEPDGRIVAAGGPFTAQNGSDFFVARYAAVATPVTPPPTTTTPPTPSPGPAPKKKKCKKKKSRAAAAKKCKKKK